MQRLSPLSWALATAALGSTAHAQALPGGDDAAADPASPAPQQVIVTATRSGKALDKIPGAVAVISRQDIDTQSLVSEDPSALLAAQPEAVQQTSAAQAARRPCACSSTTAWTARA